MPAKEEKKKPVMHKTSEREYLLKTKKKRKQGEQNETPTNTFSHHEED